MDGTEILVASMSVPRATGPSGALWQYHSRSDRHSKVACWGVLFDLLRQSALLRSHVAAGKVVFGINHEMRNYKQNQKKDLDLVIARPADTEEATAPALTFSGLVDRFDVVLDDRQREELSALPNLKAGPVGAVLVAMEAKAAMTAHSKARPRLFDELNSSHQIVHGASRNALAVGFVMINASPTFVSPSFGGTRVNKHSQPAAAKTVIEKVKEIPRRGGINEEGYDGLAVVVVSAANDGSPVTLVTADPAPPRDDIFNYEMVITRVAHEYDASFSSI